MAEMTAADVAGAAERRGLVVRGFGGLKNLVFGTLLCTTPVTAIVALGWLMGYMRRVVLRRLGVNGTDPRQNPGWLLGPRGSGLTARLFGGLWSNLRTGLGGLVSLALATLPFTALWLFAWWAGWENSFNKGYEQSWVGPTVGLLGVFVGLFVMIYLPMGLAHQAVEGKWRAFFEIHRVRRLLAVARWRSVLLAIATVIAALPLFAARGLPVFIEGIVPGFADLPAEKIDGIRGLIALVSAGYVFVSLVILRGWAARLYAFAARRAVAAEGGEIWQDATVARLIGAGPREAGTATGAWLVLRVVRTALLLTVWFGLVAQIFVSQFLHHNWWAWVNHPFLVLPWLA